MAWEFSTDAEYAQKLDWARDFVREEIEPLDLVWAGEHYAELTGDRRLLLHALQGRVRDAGLWACHLGPNLGGAGFGQVKLALLNEVLGRSDWAPRVFGCQAPDSGNAELLAHFGTQEQKDRFLAPLLAGEILSCFSMTEPQGGSDPGVFTTRAVRDGDSWVIDGVKWFSSNARHASLFIVMAVTDVDAGPYSGMSMFLVPSDTPGVQVERDIAIGGHPESSAVESVVRYEGVRVPLDHLIGGEGRAFHVAQTRLGGGRVHHAMRTVGLCQRAFDMICERVLSRTTKGSLLADKQAVSQAIADCHLKIVQLRLLVMHTAWKIDKWNDYRKVRHDIAAVKVLAPQVLEDVIRFAMHVHGSLGVSNDLPLAQWWITGPALALADGPTELHRDTITRVLLRDHVAAPGLWPSEHIPSRLPGARDLVERRLREVSVG